MRFCCCWPWLVRHANPLRESLVSPQPCSTAGGSTDAAAENASLQQQLPQRQASLQRLILVGNSSSCPNLHLLEQQHLQPPAVQKPLKQQCSTHSKAAGGLDQKSRSSQESSSHKTAVKAEVGIELKPAESNPYLGVDHLTAGRSFVKARPGAL